MKSPITVDELKQFLDDHESSGATISSLQLSTDNSLKVFGIENDITNITIEMVHKDGKA